MARLLHAKLSCPAIATARLHLGASRSLSPPPPHYLSFIFDHTGHRCILRPGCISMSVPSTVDDLLNQPLVEMMIVGNT